MSIDNKLCLTTTKTGLPGIVTIYTKDCKGLPIKYIPDKNEPDVYITMSPRDYRYDCNSYPIDWELLDKFTMWVITQTKNILSYHYFGADMTKSELDDLLSLIHPLTDDEIITLNKRRIKKGAF